MIRSWALRGGAALLLALGLAAAGLWLYARTSLPKLSGSERVAGISGKVEILRDRHGVPHITARSREDAYFGLGYVHAQDRLWQMHLNRHLGHGRLAELLGPRAVPHDRFLRMLGFTRLAERRLAAMPPETRRLLEAYAAGVNAALANHRGALPPEFLLLRLTPEPWQPADSMVYQSLMALDLGGNWRSELLRLRLSDRLDAEQLAQFFAPYPGDGGGAVPSQATLYRELDRNYAIDRLLAAYGQPADSVAGSNSWALAGSRTATGKPLLANDPHLRMSAPSLWYLAHLSWPGQDVIGATLPGLPGIVLGHNRRVAWSFTNTGADVQDVFIEKLDERDRTRYVTPEGAVPFETRHEVIKVKGEADVEITVRATRHGPVISDGIGRAADAVPAGHVLALAWTALEPEDHTMEGGLALAEAGDWAQFRRALELFGSPTQNVVYADVDGNIGFQVAGQVPIRGPDNPVKGMAPVPGWERRFDWIGRIPFDALPTAYNPPAGALATANHKIVPDNYPYYLGSEWAEPYRIRRIHELLSAQEKHSIDSFRRMQGDVVSLMAREFLPILLENAPDNEQGRQAKALLGPWRGGMDPDRPEPLLFAAWYREITRGLYADELGERFEEAWGLRPLFVRAALTGQGSWCNDRAAARDRSCREVIGEALDRAWEDLVQHHGSDPQRWRWGEPHAALMRHLPFAQVPVLQWLFNLSVPTGGDTYTIDVGSVDVADSLTPFGNIHGPGFRAIYDLDDLDRSLFMQSTGQSGNPLSPLYANFLQPWAEVEFVPMSTQAQTARAGALGTLVLLPQ